MSNSSKTQSPPHIALLPSSGMGHLTPFLRLASSLLHQNYQLTFITTYPTVSHSETQLISKFLSTYPQVTSKQFHLLPFDPSIAKSNDPFFLQFEAIRRSASLLIPLLTSSVPPLSALVTDITLCSAFLPITSDLHLPNFILFTSSAKMLCLLAYFPSLAEVSEEVHIPGLSKKMPKSWIPSILLDFTTLFATQFFENGKMMKESNGILVNTFESFEPESLGALSEGKVVNGLPPIIPIGPLVPCEFERGSSPLSWLDDQPDSSVVYVSFGSRTAISKEQISELGIGLVRSGCRFVWVVKNKKVDKEEEEGLEEVLGVEFIEKVKEKGLALKTWVDQGEVLSHKSVGGFVSHCGWNSVSEAAWNGVPMLAWPQAGDQKINAELVRKSGLGIWNESWGWGGEVVVKGEEIGEKIKELMGSEGLRLQAGKVREEARKAVGVGGSSEAGFFRLRKFLEPSE